MIIVDQPYLNFQLHPLHRQSSAASDVYKRQTLSHDEHQRVIDLCVKESKGKVPVIAGTGSNSTEEAISLTSHAEKAGADGALIVTPYYNI